MPVRCRSISLVAVVRERVRRRTDMLKESWAVEIRAEEKHLVGNAKPSENSKKAEEEVRNTLVIIIMQR